ncbi:MAG: hypothetical protein H6719_37505 [Sandaracinaceae bacterium]|nr:hypothetical protein [Sandaracinaceae bacterium]
MKLGRQLRVLLGVLFGVQVVTALAGIGLLERMSPAIGHILDENVVSVEAVEAMLAVLAHEHPAEAERAQFLEALTAAEGNVTEPEERPLLEELRARSELALDGDAVARASVIEDLGTLGSINRRAMARADREARRIGSAGRWALAFLALAGLFAIVISARRTRSSLLAPLLELQAVVASHESGDRLRRCRPLPESELGQVLASVNAMLDRVARRATEERGSDETLRAAIVLLMDEREAPALLLDESGEVLATSRAAFDLMAESGEAILTAARAAEAHDAIREITSAPTGLRLVHLNPSG